MSGSGSFGVNYKKSFTGTELPLPASVGAVGSLPEGKFIFVQADGAVAQYAFVKISDDGQADELNTTNDTVDSLQVGVAQVAAADNEYLWVWIGVQVAEELVRVLKVNALHRMLRIKTFIPQPLTALLMMILLLFL